MPLARVREGADDRHGSKLYRGGVTFIDEGDVAMVRSELILLGYWRGEGADAWPDPVDFIDSDWDGSDRRHVADYLGRGFKVRAYRGYSRCRLCGRANGSMELSDGTYVWPEGLAHYLVEHSVRPPEPFVSHALTMIRAFQSAGRDDSWWRGQIG